MNIHEQVIFTNCVEVESMRVHAVAKDGFKTLKTFDTIETAIKELKGKTNNDVDFFLVYEGQTNMLTVDQFLKTNQ